MTKRQEAAASGNEKDRLSEVGLPILVRDLMTPDPIVVEPAATVKDIAQLLLEHDVRCVPVIDMGGVLVGVVSEADLVCREGYPTVRSHHLAALIDHAVAEHRHHWTARAEGLTAGEIMTTEVVTCRPAEAVPVASRRMLEVVDRIKWQKEDPKPSFLHDTDWR